MAGRSPAVGAGCTVFRIYSHSFLRQTEPKRLDWCETGRVWRHTRRRPALRYCRSTTIVVVSCRQWTQNLTCQDQNEGRQNRHKMEAKWRPLPSWVFVGLTQRHEAAACRRPAILKHLSATTQVGLDIKFPFGLSHSARQTDGNPT